MPRFLSLYTPLTPNAGPADPAHMAEMGKMMEEQMRLGKLVATGALKRRDTDALSVRLEGGVFSVDAKPQADWMRANGFAILQGDTREEVVEGVKQFLTMVGGGTSELIEITGGPAPG